MGLTSFLYRNVLDPFTTVVAHPIKSISAAISPNKTFKEVVAKTVAEPKAQQIGEVITTGLAVGSIFGAAKAVVTKGVAKVASSLIPSTTKGKVIAAIATPAAISAVASNPKIISSAASLPSQSAAFGADVGKFTADPTLDNALNIVKENPVISAIVGTGALALGAGSLVTAVGALENVQTRESVQDLVKEIKTTGEQPISTPVTNNQIPVATAPQAGQTQKLVTTSPIRKASSSKRKQIKPQNISQRVNVIVSNKSQSVGIKQSKNYLKRSILA